MDLHDQDVHIEWLLTRQDSEHVLMNIATKIDTHAYSRSLEMVKKRKLLPSHIPP
jgi:hypothetical protein